MVRLVWGNAQRAFVTCGKKRAQLKSVLLKYKACVLDPYAHYVRALGFQAYLLPTYNQ